MRDRTVPCMPSMIFFGKRTAMLRLLLAPGAANALLHEAASTGRSQLS